MDMVMLVGSIAACLTTAAFVPQVVKARASRHTRDLSLLMFLLLTAGLILWIVYGVATRSIPVIAANTITLGMALYLIFLKVKYG